MKKKIMLMTTLVAAMFAVNSNEVKANNHALDVKVKLVKTTNKKVRLFVNQPNVILEVALRNEGGEVLYSGFVNNVENIGKQFDLSSLVDGNYTLTVLGSNFTSTQNIAITNGVISVIDGGYNEVAKPEFQAISKNVFGLFTNKPVDVSISNPYGEEIYETTVSENKGFNLDSLPSGKYTFSFVIGNKVFTEIVKVER